MDVLIKDCKDIEVLINKINSEKNNPILMLEIEIENKKKFECDFEKILNYKKKNKKKIKIFCLRLKILKIENWIKLKYINNIKKEFDIVIGYGGTNSLNRFFIEDLKIDFLMDCHNDFFFKKIDFIHHFNSGLNQNLMKISKDNNVSFLISLNFFYENKNNFLKSKEIGRINQNIKFFQKYKFDFSILFVVENLEDYISQKKISNVIKFFNLSTENIKKNSFVISKKIVEIEKFICSGISKI